MTRLDDAPQAADLADAVAEIMAGAEFAIRRLVATIDPAESALFVIMPAGGALARTFLANRDPKDRGRTVVALHRDPTEIAHFVGVTRLFHGDAASRALMVHSASMVPGLVVLGEGDQIAIVHVERSAGSAGGAS